MSNLQLVNKWAKASSYDIRIGMSIFTIRKGKRSYSSSVEMFNKYNRYELHDELVKIGKTMEGIL